MCSGKLAITQNLIHDLPIYPSRKCFLTLFLRWLGVLILCSAQLTIFVYVAELAGESTGHAEDAFLGVAPGKVQAQTCCAVH